MFDKKVWDKNFRNSPIGKIKHLQWTKEWRKKNPEKNKEACKRYQIQYQILLKELKSNGCAICGYDSCQTSLHFHHVNSEEKKFQITIRTVSRKDTIAEINKCILLCSNCHGEITELERKR